MAADIRLNGVVYSGTIASPAAPFKPTSLEVVTKKIGTSLVAESGARTFVLRSVKHTWTIGWTSVNETTRAAVRAIHELTTTWPFRDELGVLYTVQTEDEDFKETFDSTDVANVTRYNLTLTVREA